MNNETNNSLTTTTEHLVDVLDKIIVDVIVDTDNYEYAMDKYSECILGKTYNIYNENDLSTIFGFSVDSLCCDSYCKGLTINEAMLIDLFTSNNGCYLTKSEWLEFAYNVRKKLLGATK